MASTLSKALLVALFVVLGGCAPWKSDPVASYVTVEADPRHDTADARKSYEAARKQMDKYASGKKCDLAKAEKSLQEALTADVRFGPAHHSLGVLYFWQKKLYLAAWEFEYANRLMPDRFEPLNNLGLVYESAGKYEQARSFYMLARQQASNHPEVISNLARASYRAGLSVDEMRPLLEDVVATDSRPDFRRWAEELLGLDGKPSSGQRLVATLPTEIFREDAAAFPIPSGEQSPTVEDLPLILPPAPTSQPASPASSTGNLPLPLSEMLSDPALGSGLLDWPALPASR